MKTGDNTFDDIYVSKETGKVVGVILDERDYKLVPFRKCDNPMAYKMAKKKTRDILSSLCSLAFIEAPNMNKLADRIVDCVYRKEDEK
ncbi:hypothetical protein [Lacticaseibacillus paracasei]|uniref:Phage protein n=1 Tax=Lacticaseibacillus paracasei NRIC 0644 TaxID=1435038 RepID=A0A0C9QAF1_LACPA|nr:hypothetical protein [Lacticaseibacillus paracasei]GAN35653.1 phage protein [Lacticaseibacillus paracasei NRIC 0644]GAN38888.1 phage protein [Lacticaseibacillus paracasei NRIC 1917]